MVIASIAYQRYFSKHPKTDTTQHTIDAKTSFETTQSIKTRTEVLPPMPEEKSASLHTVNAISNATEPTQYQSTIQRSAHVMAPTQYAPATDKSMARMAPTQYAPTPTMAMAPTQYQTSQRAPRPMDRTQYQTSVRPNAVSSRPMAPTQYQNSVQDQKATPKSFRSIAPALTQYQTSVIESAQGSSSSLIAKTKYEASSREDIAGSSHMETTQFQNLEMSQVILLIR